MVIFNIWKNIHRNPLCGIKSIYKLIISLRNIIIILFIDSNIGSVKMILFFSSNILNLSFQCITILEQANGFILQSCEINDDSYIILEAK